ncbi:MAG: four helix bundle protein [Cytophagaceae bacterium]|nr:four helix bundle protein [Cytophagaceae bacterium]
METKNYKDLILWQKAREMVKTIYIHSKDWPQEEKFGLPPQLRRSSISIPSNIAEGIGRKHSKDTIQFLFIAKGSLYEMETQLFLALDLNFITQQSFDKIEKEIIELRKLLLGFIKFKTKRNASSALSAQHS